MGCCGQGECSAPRSFLTKAEKIEMLKEYQDSLEREAEAVKERIAELGKGK